MTEKDLKKSACSLSPLFCRILRVFCLQFDLQEWNIRADWLRSGAWPTYAQLSGHEKKKKNPHWLLWVCVRACRIAVLLRWPQIGNRTEFKVKPSMRLKGSSTTTQWPHYTCVRAMQRGRAALLLDYGTNQLNQWRLPLVSVHVTLTPRCTISDYRTHLANYKTKQTIEVFILISFITLQPFHCVLDIFQIVYFTIFYYLFVFYCPLWYFILF